MRAKIYCGMDEALREPTQVKILDLSHQKMTAVPAEIGCFTHLEELDLSSNELQTLPHEIARLKNVKILWLTGNFFDEVPSVIFELPNLQRLYLSYNNIKLLPEIHHNSPLESLWISHNKLQEIHCSWQKVKSLRILIANCNQLSTIPQAICQMQELRKVDVSENRVVEIPKEIQWNTLEVLHIWNNHLECISDNIGKLQCLQELDMSGNYLHELPDTIGELKKLHTLDVRKNHIEKIPTTIGECNALKHLFLSYNKIITLPDSMKNLKLEELAVYNNCLELLPAFLASMTSLQSVSFKGNSISEQQMTQLQKQLPQTTFD